MTGLSAGNPPSSILCNRVKPTLKKSRVVPRRGRFRRLGLALAVCAAGAGCHASYAYRAIELTPVAVTSADYTDRGTIRFLAFGDSGTGNRRQQAVADGMAEVCLRVGCDFGVVLGDIIYDEGIESANDPQLIGKFHDPYDKLGLELWLAPGNHDWYSPAALQPAIDHSVAPENSSGSWKMPYNYFSVPGLPDWLHLFALDTTVFHELAGEDDPARQAALEQVAEAQLRSAREALCGRSGWRILFGHHFVYSNGSSHGGDSGRIAPWLEPLIEECAVQVVLAGHDHHLEHLVVDGYDQVIAGSAGEARSLRQPPVDGPEQRFALAELGFVLVTVSSEALAVEWYRCEESGGCRPAYRMERTAGAAERAASDAATPGRTTAPPATDRAAARPGRVGR